MVNITLTPTQRRVVGVFRDFLDEYHRAYPETGADTDNVYRSKVFEEYAGSLFPGDLSSSVYGKYFATTFYNIVMEGDNFQPDEIQTYLLLKLFERAGIDPAESKMHLSKLVKFVEELEFRTEVLKYCIDNMIFVPEQQFTCVYRKIFGSEKYRYYIRFLPARYCQKKDPAIGKPALKFIIQVRYRQKP